MFNPLGHLNIPAHNISVSVETKQTTIGMHDPSWTTVLFKAGVCKMNKAVAAIDMILRQ